MSLCFCLLPRHLVTKPAETTQFLDVPSVCGVHRDPLPREGGFTVKSAKALTNYTFSFCANNFSTQTKIKSAEGPFWHNACMTNCSTELDFIELLHHLCVGGVNVWRSQRHQETMAEKLTKTGHRLPVRRTQNLKWSKLKQKHIKTGRTDKFTFNVFNQLSRAQ